MHNLGFVTDKYFVKGFKFSYKGDIGETSSIF